MSQVSVTAARDAIARMLHVSVRLPEAYKQAQLLPQPVDMTPMLIDTLALQSRAIALLFDEIMVLSGQGRSIKFNDGTEKPANGEEASPITLVES